MAIALPLTFGAAAAATITQTLGGQSYSRGDYTDDTTFESNHVGHPAPFDGTVYGNDFDTNQTFTFSECGAIEVWEATLFIGLYDHVSLGTGDQVLSFTAGAVDLTALLNAAFEGFQTDTDQVGYYLLTDFERCELFINRIVIPELDRRDGAMFYEAVFG